MREADPGPDSPYVTIVLPARNEAARIHDAITSVARVLNSLGESFEIVVGDSASTDGTGDIALGAGVPGTRVVRSERPGKGRILAEGLAAARGEIVGFLDSDLDIPAEYLPAAIRAVQEGADAAIGSKLLRPSEHRRGPLRQVVTRVSNRVLRTMLGTPFSDHQAGLKVFRRGALQPALESVRATGWLWDAELLTRMHRQGTRIEEVPIVVVSRRESHFVSPRQLLGASLEMLRITVRCRFPR